MIKLTIELVPASSWFNNVRSQVTKYKWEKLKKYTFKRAHYKCEICGQKGRCWPVECHEEWEYDDEHKIYC